MLLVFALILIIIKLSIAWESDILYIEGEDYQDGEDIDRDINNTLNNNYNEQ